jgi:trimeric autotransporter adhesin
MKKISITIILTIFYFSLYAQDNSYFGQYAGPVGPNKASLQRATAIGINAKVSANDALILGDTTLVKVGIGMSNPQYRLDVKGVFNMRVAYNTPSMKINDRNFIELDKQGQFVLNEFKIKYASEGLWSDKVFEKNYPLMSLTEVSAFIEQNQHLPNVPSAKEVVTDGVSMNEMVSKLLEKIEELTLYTIQQQKEIEALKKVLK